MQVAESLIEDLKDKSVLVLAPHCMDVPSGVSVIRVSRNLFIRFIQVSSYLTLLSLFYNTRVLTLFGPNPSLFSSAYHIQGFAKPKIIYGELVDMSPLERIVLNLQMKSLKNADLLWCESEDVKKNLLSQLKMDSVVISNALHQEFLNLDASPIRSASTKNELRLGYVGANYAHKNYRILLKVLDILSRRGLRVSLTTTLNDDDFESVDDLQRVNNLGRQNRSGLSELYKSVDLIVLPSTLECFSVTPLEAIYFRKSCIVGDFSFNRTVYRSWVDYTNVLDAELLAETIMFRHGNPKSEHELDRIADEMLSTYPVDARNDKLINLLFDETSYTKS